MSLEPTSLGPNWWTSLTHGGLLMAPAMVEKFFSQDLPALQPWRADTLRRALTRRAETGVRQLLDTVFLQVLGHDPARWNRNPPSDQWSHGLEACDHPERELARNTFARTLNSKGFWRIDKEQPPHLRHTVLSLVAFHELERIGLDAFLNLNDGDGWMLPEKLRLADYGLGHDDRAKEYQPVASVLGDRFYDWQLAQTVEESWEECARHAELIAKIVPAAHSVGPELLRPQATFPTIFQ